MKICPGKVVPIVVCSAMIFIQGTAFSAENKSLYKGYPPNSVPVVSIRGASSLQTFFEYLPDPRPEANPLSGAPAPDISERFLGILRNTGAFASGDVDNTLHTLLAEYYVRTGDLEKAYGTVAVIKDPAARLDRIEWLIMSLLDAGDIAAAENAISEGLKSTNALQDSRDLFTSQVLLELCNRGLYSFATNIPVQKGLLGDADSDCLQILARAGSFVDMYDGKSARRELGKIGGIISAAEEMAVPIYVYMADMYHKAGAEADSEKAFKEAFYASKKNMFFEFIAVRAAIAGHFDVVKNEAKTVFDLVKGPEYKAVSDAFSGIAEYFERTGDKGKSREAIALAEENAAKLPEGKEKMSALARIALFYENEGDDDAALKKFGEISEIFKKLPMRTLGYYYENAVFLDGILKRFAGSGLGESASDILSYLLDLTGKFESEGKKSGEKMDSVLVIIAERAYDLARYEEMTKAYDRLKNNAKKTEVLRYAVWKKAEPAKEKLSGMIEEMLKASDEGKLTAGASADARITAAEFYAGEGDPGKAAAQLSLALKALAMIDNSGDAGGVKNKYHLTAKAAEIYFDLGEAAKALEIAESIMNDASQTRNGDLKKSLAGSAMQALVHGYAKDKKKAPEPYAPGMRHREYSKIYW